MLERDIEKYLVKKCKELNVYCRKFSSPQQRSVPDRILIYKGVTVFVELKATGKLPEPAQRRELDRIIEHGALALHVNSITAIDHLLGALCTTH